MNNVLVVGGAGFIGSSLCEKLLENNKVVCVDNLMRGKIKNLSSIFNNVNFKFIELDVNDIPKLEEIIYEENINFIFHLAANSDIQASANNPQIEFDCTAKTTWSILSAMKKTGVKNLFFASTSAVYGEMADKPFSENSVLNPISYYGSAKMASEAFIKSFAFMNDFNALIFRFPNVVGPRLTHGVFFDFINQLKKDPSHLTVLGNGTQSKPYMHVYDLVEAINLLIWNNKGVNIFNIGVETSTSVKSIASMVINEMHLDNCKILYGTENIGWKGDVPKFSYSLGKIYSTGWKASMISDEAALRCIKEVLHHDN